MKVRDIIAENSGGDPGLDHWRAEIAGLAEKPASFRAEADDALARLCGDRRIGRGAYRQVWPHRDDPDLVVKIDGLGRLSAYANELHNGKAAHNYRERRNWLAAQQAGLADWFAPVEWASPDCWVILQAKAEQQGTESPWGGAADPAAFPAKMPVLFKESFDTQWLSNWGVIDGRPVLIDYSWMLPADISNLTEPAPVRVERGCLVFDAEAAA